MRTALSIDSKHPLCGVWIASDQDETNDYNEAEYCISVVRGKFRVSGVDKMDGEQFEISNVTLDGNWLTFETLMPSTKRRGIMKLRIKDTNEIELEFTFTATEIWHRKRKT